MPEESSQDSAVPHNHSSSGAGSFAPLELDEVAWLFPQYAILGVLGGGAVGTVYRAFDAAGDRSVAIKVLPLEISTAPGVARNFANVLPPIATLNHANIVTVREFGLTSRDHLFVIMDFVEGTTLRERIASKALTPPQVFAILEQVCDALNYAHGSGVKHGLLHPGNIFVDRRGPVRLADFGMARFGSRNLMQTAENYFSPEQASGLQVGHRADIFSLGIILYEALTGELPHADSPRASEVAPVDPHIDAVIARAMRPEPERRYHTCAEMMRAIATVRALASPVGLVAQAPTFAAPRVPRPAAVAAAAPAKKNISLWMPVTAVVVVVAAIAFFAMRPAKTPARPTPQTKVAARPIAAAAPAVAAAKPFSEVANPEPPAPSEPVPEPPAGTWLPVPLEAGRIEGATALDDGGVHLTKTARFDRFRAKDVAIRATIRLGESARSAQIWLRDSRMARAQIVIDPRPSCYLQTMMENKYRGVGTVAIPPADEAGGWVTVEFAAVGGRLLGTANGVGIAPQDSSDVLEAGGIGLYSIDADFKDVTVMILDGVAPEEYPEFVTVVLVPKVAKAPETASSPMPAEAPPPAPTPEPPKAASEVGKWLAEVEKPFLEAYQRDVMAPFEKALGELRRGYLATLERQLASASQAAKLEEALSWRGERQRFLDGGQRVPADDSDNPIAPIKPVRASFRTQFAKLDRERFERARAQFAKIDAVLAQNQTALTQRLRLDDALLVKNKRDELSKSWLAPPASVPPVAETKPVVGPPKQALRDTVAWLLANSAELTVWEANKWAPVTDARQLPGPKPLFRVKIDAAKFKTAPTPDDFRRLVALRNVASFETPSRFGNGAFAFLRELEGVERVLFPGDQVSDAIVENLAPLVALKSIQIRGGANWTGKSFDALAKLSGLRGIDVEGSAFNDEGAAAVARIEALEELHLRKTKITDAGILHLAKLRNLRRIDVNETAVTVDGLAPLKALKELESIGFLTENLPDYSETVQKLAALFPRLTGTRVHGKALGAEHFGPLSNWRSLTHLLVRESSLREGATAGIGQITGLESLEISYSTFGDVDVDGLLTLKALKKLNLSNTKITDKGLLKLKALKSLKEVTVTGTPVTTDGMRALDRDHAGCKVIK